MEGSLTCTALTNEVLGSRDLGVHWVLLSRHHHPARRGLQTTGWARSVWESGVPSGFEVRGGSYTCAS